MLFMKSLRQHWPARKSEWFMAAILTTWGAYVWLHPEMFHAPSTQALLSGLAMISASFTIEAALFWGPLCVVVGIGRMIALFINGAWTRTPLIRVAASFVSMFVFTQILIGLWDSGVPNTGLVIYPWFVVADLISAYRAATDAVLAQMQRDVGKETRSVSSYDRFPA